MASDCYVIASSKITSALATALATSFAPAPFAPAGAVDESVSHGFAAAEATGHAAAATEAPDSAKHVCWPLTMSD